jgi:hypothetical protein
MARLFGRRVHQVNFVLNVDGTYNGYTHWGRDEFIRDWDQNLPYQELELKQAESKNGVALVIVAGKAAERIWYQKRNLDETLANFGLSGSNFNDEHELERELLYAFPLMKQEELSQAKQVTENLAIRLLESKVCWQAIETVSQVLLERLRQGYTLSNDVQQIIADVFEKAALNIPEKPKESW